MKTGRIILVVVGALVLLLGLGMGAGAAALGLLNAAQDDDRYLSVPQATYEVDSYALTSGELDIDADDVEGTLGRLRVRGTAAGSDAGLFIGIAATRDVDRYLADTAHSELRDVTFDPFTAEYRETGGTAVPAPPADQDFWQASSVGTGEQAIEWDLIDGDWTVVVMNADATRPVAAELQMGVQTELFGWLARGLVIAAVVFVLGGIALILLAILAGRRDRNRPGGDYPAGGYPGQAGRYPVANYPGGGYPGGGYPGAAADYPGQGSGYPVPGADAGPGASVDAASGASAAVAAGTPAAVAGLPARAARFPDADITDTDLPGARYPARLYGELDPGLSRWLWLVKWFLAIPHWFLLVFLWIAFGVATIAAGFAILFTGRYPRALFDFNVGVLRWSWRVSFYASRALGTDKYPPFTLDRTDYPADFDVDYPQQLSRGLVLVKWWLLVLPQALVVAAFTGGALFFRDSGGFDYDGGQWRQSWNGQEWSYEGWDSPTDAGGISLLTLLVVIAALALLFTARYPRPLFNFIMGLNRWAYRVLAYGALMRDEYPPFRLDQGPSDPRDRMVGLAPGAGHGPGHLPEPRPPEGRSTEPRPPEDGTG